MIQKHSGYLSFRIDPLLNGDVKKHLESLFSEFKDLEVQELKDWFPTMSGKLIVDFVSENSLHLIKAGPHIKLCILDRNQGLFSFGQNLESSDADAILDDTVDLNQIERLISSDLQKILKSKEEALVSVASKNLKKFESKSKLLTQKTLEADSSLTSELFLDYTQELVELEKDLIHSDDLSKTEKVIKQFIKNHVEKAKFQLYSSADMWKVTPSKNLLPLPRYRGEFVLMEMNWEDEDRFRLIKKIFFYYTLINYFNSQQEIEDPFFDESLWESVLDSVPFPVALLSEEGEVYQHNTLFAKFKF